MGIVNCPLPASPTKVTKAGCRPKVGRIVKIVLQRKGHKFTATNPITDLDSWLDLRDANDASTLAVLPLLGDAAVITPGEPETSNVNAYGVDEVVEEKGSNGTALLNDLEGSTIETIRAWNHEGSITAYFLTADNNVFARKLAVAGEYSGFNLLSFFCGDMGVRNGNNRDEASLTFNLPSGWRKDGVLVPLDFDVNDLEGVDPA